MGSLNAFFGLYVAVVAIDKISQPWQPRFMQYYAIMASPRSAENVSRPSLRLRLRQLVLTFFYPRPRRRDFMQKMSIWRHDPALSRGASRKKMLFWHHRNRNNTHPVLTDGVCWYCPGEKHRPRLSLRLRRGMLLIFCSFFNSYISW
jgi:hypothetical protein